MDSGPEGSAPTKDADASSPVLEHVAARARALAAGGSREDGRRLGLVVEGGAMRGVVSGGVLVGLEDLGLGEVFDVAFGSSAGAVNLAYFVGGAAAAASAIYLDHAASLRFVNPFRLPRVLDLDYLFEEVIRQRFPFNVERLRSGPTELFASVTDVHTGRNRLLSLRDPRLDPYDALKASSAVPFYHGPPVPVAGGEYLDGLASDALPVGAALAAGCTDVLVVLSAPRHAGPARRPRVGHDIPWPERLLLRRHSRGFRRSYLTRRRRARRTLDLAFGDPRVHVLEPLPDAPVPSHLTRDREALAAALEAGRRHAHAVLAPWGLLPREGGTGALRPASPPSPGRPAER